MKISQMVENKLYGCVGYDGFIHVYSLMSSELYFLSDYGKIWIKDHKSYNEVIHKEFTNISENDVLRNYPEFKREFVDKEFQQNFFKKLKDNIKEKK